MARPEIRFGRFELRPQTRELCERGRALRIGERAFDVLLALVEAGGRPLSRDALFERAWPGRSLPLAPERACPWRSLKVMAVSLR